ncbi:2-hydroxycarboxylate transporter family protein, partial [Methylobacterium sp.]
MTSTASPSPIPSPAEGRVENGRAARFWPDVWWRLIDFKIGIIPLPIFVILAILLTVLVQEGEIKPDGPTMIAVLVMGGFTCAEIGKRIPILKNIGAGAIFATFIPSALVYYALVPPQMVKAITDFTKFTNFLYIYIATIIVGSILGMDREVLIKGFLKIFAPLALGSVAAALVGTLVG